MPQICGLLLVCLPAQGHLTAQTVADRESVNEVVEGLFAAAGMLGTEISHSPGTWSLVIARFAKGDSREVAIPAEAAEAYTVVGRAESLGTDIDICIYGPAGDQVDCDTLLDGVPLVSFTAETEGTYRAVLTAASVEGGGTSFGGMLVSRDLDEGDERGGGGEVRGDRSVDLAWGHRGSAASRRLGPEETLVPGPTTLNGSLSSSDTVLNDGSHCDV